MQKKIAKYLIFISYEFTISDSHLPNELQSNGRAKLKKEELCQYLGHPFCLYHAAAVTAIRKYFSSAGHGGIGHPR